MVCGDIPMTTIRTVRMPEGLVGQTVTDRLKLDEVGFDGGTIRGDVKAARDKLASLGLLLAVVRNGRVHMVATPEERAELGDDIAEIWEWSG